MAKQEKELARSLTWSQFESGGLASGLDRKRRGGKSTLPVYARDLGRDWRLTDDGLELGKPKSSRTFTTPTANMSRSVVMALADSEEIPDELEDRSPEDLLEEEVGNDGTNYVSGRPYRGKNREYDQAITWRGLRTDYGVAHNIYLTSPMYQRPVNSATQQVCSGIWSVQPADVSGLAEGEEAKRLAQAAEEQASDVQRAVDGLEGGLQQFLTEAIYSLSVPGFGIWLRIHREDGTLRKLAYRRPNTLDRVILDEGETRILAFVFKTPSGGEEYVVDVRDCLVLTASKIGTDIEGLSPFRSVAEWVRAKQLLTERFMYAVEKHGSPRDVVEATADYKEADGDADKVADALDYRVSGQQEDSLIMPAGLVAKTLSPGSSFPPVLDFIRYCDEVISTPLSSEGALLGQGKTGSYALADVKDDQSLRVAVFLANQIADRLNGLDNSPMSGPLRSMVDAMGGPVVEGRYPELVFSLGEEEVALADITAAAAQGLVVVTPEVQDHVHERLKLPVVVREEEIEEPKRSPALVACDHHDHDVQGWADGVDVESNRFADFDPEDALDAHDRTNEKVGRAFEKVARDQRRWWTTRTNNIDSGAAVLRVREQMREEFMPQYREAAIPAVNELRAKGGLSIARELDIIPSVPKSVKDAPGTGRTLQMADAMALRAYNTVEAYLLERKQLELNGAPQATYPEIPTRSAFTKAAAATTAAAFSQGRDEMVKELVRATTDQGPQGKEPRIIAEYSSVLDGNTCDPCSSTDGRRVFVGSKAYERIKPPSVCEGRNRCRCIFTYIMPDEADYDEIFEKVARGFSQVSNTARLSDEPTGLDMLALAYARSKGDT